MGIWMFVSSGVFRAIYMHLWVCCAKGKVGKPSEHIAGYKLDNQIQIL